jgi:choline dehydrogenase
LKGLIGKEAIDKSIPHDPQSDEYLREYARRAAITIYHPVGTVKMGARSDPTAVVDPELKVKGLNALRVADASVMPVICSGNTNAPTIMIAEKASDLILSRVKQ